MCVCCVHIISGGGVWFCGQLKMQMSAEVVQSLKNPMRFPRFKFVSIEQINWKHLQTLCLMSVCPPPRHLPRNRFAVWTHPSLIRWFEIISAQPQMRRWLIAIVISGCVRVRATHAHNLHSCTMFIIVTCSGSRLCVGFNRWRLADWLSDARATMFHIYQNG